MLRHEEEREFGTGLLQPPVQMHARRGVDALVPPRTDTQIVLGWVRTVVVVAPYVGFPSAIVGPAVEQKLPGSRAAVGGRQLDQRSRQTDRGESRNKHRCPRNRV